MEKQITNDSLSPKVSPTVYNFWKSRTKGLNTAQLVVIGIMLTFFVVALVSFVTKFINGL